MALAGKENCTYPADWFDAAEVFEFDLAEAPSLARAGAEGPLSAKLWREPGIGAAPDTKRLEGCCIDRAEIA